MEINHFSHVHPLILSQEKHNTNFRCGVCAEHIFGLSYSCQICPYILHRWCSDLPRRLTSNKKHLPDHPLILAPQNDPSCTTLCNACNDPIKISAFYYKCEKVSECLFSLHVECATFPELSSEVQINGHTTRFGLFNDDSRTRFKAPSRQCYLCKVGETDFLLHSPIPDEYFTFHHIQCGMLPQKVKHRVHLHELTLRPPLPQNEWYFEFFCDACEKTRDPKDPIYYCESCEFVAHIGCGFTGSEPPIQNILDTCPIYGSSILVEKEEEIIEDGGEENEEEGENLIEVHEHPLVLRNIRRRETGTCCIGCNSYVFGLTYYCESCGFYIHKRCAKLSQRLEYPKHPDHGPLVLFASIRSGSSNSVRSDPVGRRCELCGKLITGNNYYGCEKCDFVVDGLCAHLPDDINHPSHEHTLTLAIHEPIKFDYNPIYSGTDYDSNHYKFPWGMNESPLCEACRYPCQDVTLECKGCNFYLHVHCFLLPQRGKHITHRHNLSLSYTYQEDPRALEFYCDCCEKPRTPNRWVYRCPDPECDIVAHVNCIVPYPLILANSENPN